VRRSSPFPVPELDLHRYELRINGNPIRLEKIPMELLIFLVEHRDKLVSREAIVERLWGQNVYVDTEQGINTAVRKIRHALGDDSEQTRFLQTVVGKGYRFIGPVTLIDNRDAVKNGKGDSARRESPAAPVQPPAETVAPGIRRSWAIPVLIAGLFILAAVLAGMRLSGMRSGGSPVNPEIRSVAVLPFENLSGDPGQEYFATGIADVLLTNLAQIHSLRVISRTSSLQYQGSRKSLPAIAKELNVDAVVEGTFSRSGDQVRITAQLIRAATDQHLWAETYERSLEDVLSLESEIALDVARKVSATVNAQEQLRLARERSIDPEAQEAYFRGLYYMNLRGENLLRARDCFQEAVDKDPNFADAYAALAESYGLFVAWGLTDEKDITPKLAIAKKAVELDPESSAAHTAMAIYRRSLGDYAGSELEVKRALDLNPNNSSAHRQYGYYLHVSGRFEEAISELTRAQEMDPLAAHISFMLGDTFYDAGRFDAAITQWRRAIDIDSDFQFLHQEIGWAYSHQGMHKAAIKEWSLRWEHKPRIAEILNKAYEKSGYRGYLRAHLGREFANALQPNSISDYQHALIYTELDETDHAFDALAKAVKQRDLSVDRLPVDANFQKLHSDPRFQDLVVQWKQVK
jgi:TolB-like protein/DNA-binding winged helix-turn-helix (wHTH) protein